MALTRISTDGVKDDAVTVDKMASNSVGSSQIINTGVSTDDIANQAVNADKIANNTITTLKIGDNQITTTKVADDAITQAKINVPLSNHSLVVNGDMKLAQRGASSTGNGYQTVDRFALYKFAIGNTLTQSQISLNSTDTGPYALGFRKAYRFAAAGALTANNNSEISMSHKIEAQDIASSGWDYTSSSSYITLSFWFRCSANQTFYCYLKTDDGTSQSYPFSFTASGNNTWTKITKTIPGDSNLQFDDNEGEGLFMAFVPFFGTNYTGTKTLNAWSAYANDARVPDMANDVWYAGANTFDITGVKLEVGATDTTFQHLSYGESLAKCQRYYQEGYFRIRLNGRSSNTVSEFTHYFKGTMRTGPTCTTSNELGTIASINDPDGYLGGNGIYIDFTAALSNNFAARVFADAEL
jgi:hypothetical protein|tara:strand:+ start:381 stop:1616 length:1236 start_codon:yes stop_codon:yes gene_type:complete